MRNKPFLLSLSFLAISICLVGYASATSLLTKNQEIEQKQSKQHPLQGVDTDLIGIFPHGFNSELSNAVLAYKDKYGEGNIQIISYRNFTIIVPPSKAEEVEKTKRSIDAQITGAENAKPTPDIQNDEITQIRSVFNVVGAVEYNQMIGAYTDDDGYQYNFQDGKLINKQVSASSDLSAIWLSEHPHASYEESELSALPLKITDEQAKQMADKVIEGLFDSSETAALLEKISYDRFGTSRLGITYGNNEAKVLVDKVSGEIIHYSKVY